jgi:hypothetical protein
MTKTEDNPMHLKPREPSRLRRAPRCLARTRRGTPCQSPAVAGKTRCRMHGGKADAAAKRASFKIPEFDKTDAVGELKRQELRTFVRNLPSGERVAALDTLGEDGVLAVLDAPPALSGIPADRHQFVRTRYLESKFGPQLRELELVDEDNTAFEAAATMVRKELQTATDLGNSDFAALEKSHE